MMSQNKIKKDVIIDDESTKRFEKRRSKISRTMKILSTKNPEKILKLDSEDRVKKRKKHLKEQNLPVLTIERVITGNDLMPVYYFEKGRKTANSICRIEIMNDTGNILGYGTGFMVSPSLLMTNNHVLVDKETAKNSRAQFNFEKAEDFSDKPVVGFRLDPENFFILTKN